MIIISIKRGNMLDMNRRYIEILIKNNLSKLTRQQVKTLRGQLNSGNIEGAYKGLTKILKRNKNI